MDGRGLLDPARRVGLLLAVQALLALEVDPYFELRGGGALGLPARGSLHALIAVQCGLAAAALFLRFRPAWLAAGCGAGWALVLLLASCPANTPWIHGLQAALALTALSLLLVVTGRDPDGREQVQRPVRWLVRGTLLVFPFLVLEGVFSFVPRSHAVGYTLAARLWYERCWFEVGNSSGYRDVEHAPDGRRTLLVLGDSVVSGVGICDVRERFSDRLQALFPERYQVHNLGWNGADTALELERLKAYPFRPDVLVLSYFVNDVLGAAEEEGLRIPPFRPYANLPGKAAQLVARSYLLDFAYWLLPQEDLRARANGLAASFASPRVVDRHRARLEELVGWAREQGARVVAVAFPDLAAPERSAEWLAPALEVFARLGVPAADVRELVRGLEPRETMVNRNDSHPNERTHALVAEALARLLREVDPPPGF